MIPITFEGQNRNTNLATSPSQATNDKTATETFTFNQDLREANTAVRPAQTTKPASNYYVTSRFDYFSGNRPEGDFIVELIVGEQVFGCKDELIQ
jgi:hypothetical protein